MREEKFSRTEVILSDGLDSNPSCPHGPTLLFQNASRGGGETTRQFYACSAYRSKKFCDFQHNKTDKITPGKLLRWTEARKHLLQGKDHSELFKELTRFRKSGADGYFCQTCCRLLVSPQGEGQKKEALLASHKGHVVTKMTRTALESPTRLLRPLSEDKKEAQYFFSPDSIRVLVGVLKRLNYTHVLCLGAPTIFENLGGDGRENDGYAPRRLLMDIDARFLALLGPREFCWFNMMNFHFFHAESAGGAATVYQDFLSELSTVSGGSLAIVLDPPFGARHEMLAASLRRICSDARRLNGGGVSAAVAHIFWIFPYFMEKKLVGTGLDLAMSDYRVSYENHREFGGAAGGRKQGSPVRIFTNLPLRLMALPESEGYRYCAPCQRWVAHTNLHCDACAACPSKDGRTYRHCAPCRRCVKPTYAHCARCNRCFLAGAHGCGGPGLENSSRGNLAKRSADTDSDIPPAEAVDGPMDGGSQRKKKRRKKKSKQKLHP